MRNSKEIQDDITRWFEKMDLGLSIIGINDLLLELRSSLIYESKKELIDVLCDLSCHQAPRVCNCCEDASMEMQRHLTQFNTDLKKVCPKCKRMSAIEIEKGVFQCSFNSCNFIGKPIFKS